MSGSPPLACCVLLPLRHAAVGAVGNNYNNIIMIIFIQLIIVFTDLIITIFYGSWCNVIFIDP